MEEIQTIDLKYDVILMTADLHFGVRGASEEWINNMRE